MNCENIVNILKPKNIVTYQVKHDFIALFRAYLKALSFLFSMKLLLVYFSQSHEQEFTTSACFKMLRNIGLGSPSGRKAKFKNVKGLC